MSCLGSVLLQGRGWDYKEGSAEMPEEEMALEE